MSKHVIPWRRKEKMGPAKREELHPFLALHRQMNELFDDFFRHFGEPRWRVSGREEQRWTSLSPKVDVAKTDSAIQVTAELPGLDEKDIEVTLDRNLLTIKGEKKQEREEKKKNYSLSERSYGQFQRVVALPEGVHQDQVKARFKQGVLSITIPRTEQAKTEHKKIDIAKE